jgi:hypothetical protein
MDRLEKSLRHLCWRHFAGAVLAVFLENQRRESQSDCCHKASADTWGIVDELRQDIHRRSARQWCTRVGLDSSRFPYSVDEVVRLYFRFRKRNGAEIEQFRAEIEAEQSSGLFTDGAE